MSETDEQEVFNADTPSNHIRNRSGNPISLQEYLQLKEDAEYWQIGYDQFRIGSEMFVVSTVWLGIIHPGDMIFETAIFHKGKVEEIVRYKTELEAIKGHRAFVRAFYDEMVTKEIYIPTEETYG